MSLVFVRYIIQGGVHYAEKVPPKIDRGLVLRMSFFAINSKQKINHLEWYEKIVNKNRIQNI